MTEPREREKCERKGRGQLLSKSESSVLSDRVTTH